MDKRNELVSISRVINDLLGEYVDLHNTTFKASLRNIFKPMDFNQKYLKLEQIENELIHCTVDILNLTPFLNDKENAYADCVLDYNKSLTNTVSLLKSLSYKLYLKSQGQQKFNLDDYNKELAIYRNSVPEYVSKGNKLSALYRDLIEND